MTVFDNGRPSDAYLAAGDAGTRALSTTAVESDFVTGVYQKLAGVYDYAFGPALHPGRLEAIQRMRLRPGSSILEVGVGTGINFSLYPASSTVTGIDLSSKMLEKASKRIRTQGLVHCRVLEMNAEAMAFADDSFDVVWGSLEHIAGGHARALLPCHRVLRRDGLLGGYRWGTERKRAMLAWEHANTLSASA